MSSVKEHQLCDFHENRPYVIVTIARSIRINVDIYSASDNQRNVFCHHVLVIVQIRSMMWHHFTESVAAHFAAFCPPGPPYTHAHVGPHPFGRPLHILHEVEAYLCSLIVNNMAGMSVLAGVFWLLLAPGISALRINSWENCGMLALNLTFQLGGIHLN